MPPKGSFRILARGALCRDAAQRGFGRRVVFLGGIENDGRRVAGEGAVHRDPPVSLAEALRGWPRDRADLAFQSLPTLNLQRSERHDAAGGSGADLQERRYMFPSARENSGCHRSQPGIRPARATAKGRIRLQPQPPQVGSDQGGRPATERGGGVAEATRVAAGSGRSSLPEICRAPLTSWETPKEIIGRTMAVQHFFSFRFSAKFSSRGGCFCDIVESRALPLGRVPGTKKRAIGRH